MKILLISDTHGQIDALNELAAATGADCCFHLGDLCTYTRESVGRFPADMLYKQLKHSPYLSPEQLAAIDREDAEVMRPLALAYRTCGNFEDYLSGTKSFNVPIYAVCGNNDDAEVLARLEKNPIPNLTFLNEDMQMGIEDFLICGIGGAIAERAPETGVGCISTETQIAELERKIAAAPGKKILLTHVPPYECKPLMQLVETIKPVLILCGHTHHWDDRMAGDCRIITLPRASRGYALLSLEFGKEAKLMISDNSEIREIFDALPRYSAAAGFLEKVMRMRFPGWTVQVRVKSPAGIAEKILSRRAAGDAAPLTDIIGVRLIFLRKDRLPEAELTMRKYFNTIEEQDVRDRLGAREFGYLSKHFIAKYDRKWAEKTAGELALPAPPEGEFRFEIQIRTWLQHIWAELEHDSEYKAFKATPVKAQAVRREWAMLAAAIEKLDDDLIACLHKTEAIKWPYVDKAAAQQRLNILRGASGMLAACGLTDDRWPGRGEIERLSRLVEPVTEPVAVEDPDADPLDPEAFVRRLSDVPGDKAARFFAPLLLDRSRQMVKMSNDLAWAYAGIVLAGLLTKNPDENEIFDAALRLINLCNARSVVNLVGKDVVATERTKDALRRLSDVVNKLKASGDVIRNVRTMLRLGMYAHRLDDARCGGGKPSVVILAGGCSSLDDDKGRRALDAFRKLFRRTLECGTQAIDFHTGSGTSGICSLKDTIKAADANRRIYQVRSFPGTPPKKHSIADALRGWKCLKKNGYRFDDVALIGFGINPDGISAWECRLALAFGARVTVIGHKAFEDEGADGDRCFRHAGDWSSHPSLVRLPLIAEDHPRNRSFSNRRENNKICSWCKSEGFPEPEMLRGFMLFGSFHEDDYERYRNEDNEYGKLVRIIHWQKQMKSSCPQDMKELKEEHLNSVLHRLFMFERLTRDIPIEDETFPVRYGEKEHARWYIERWLQGCRYGEATVGNFNRHMVAWHDLDDATIDKDIEYLERVEAARKAEYEECRREFAKRMAKKAGR